MSTSILLAGKRDMNIIMWMDHRAAKQADKINATQHEVLKHVGGRISLEMQTPKLLWLKEVLIHILLFPSFSNCVPSFQNTT